MGAWGSGSFENDTALDWADSVRSLADLRAPFERHMALSGRGEGGTPFLDADLASELIAAAETVAMLMGRRIPDFPKALGERLRDAGPPDDILIEQAREAVCQVLRESELAELWAETAAQDGVNDWHAAITGLIDRLNPDLDVKPWEPAEIEQSLGRPVGPCAFCDQPVAPEQLFGMTIRDYSDRMSFAQGLWFHLACLNVRLHHRHAIIDLKFDLDKLPGIDPT